MRFLFSKLSYFDSCRLPHCHVLIVVVTLLLVWCAELCSCDVYMQAQCGQTVSSLGDRIYSQSDLHYEPNTNCTVIVSARHQGEKIFLRIEDLDIRGDDDCNGDYLEIYDHSSKASVVRTRRRRLVCGTGRNVATKVTSKGDSLRLVFVTDGERNGRGFRASFTALIPDRKCREFGKFRCDNGRCISSMLTCDSVDNCDDGSDEKQRKACADHDHKHSIGKIKDGDLEIYSPVSMAIGGVLVIIFFYFCIPQCISHIVYVNKKKKQRKEKELLQKMEIAEVESGQGSTGHPSITSLRSFRPSQTSPTSQYLPHWEVKLSELYDTRSSTVSLRRDTILPTVANRVDRDRAVADVVSAGKKVHIGRFMVQKSVIEEEPEEEKADDGGSDYEDEHEVPLKRSRGRSRTKSSETDDEPQETGWIRRMEARVSRRHSEETITAEESARNSTAANKRKQFAKSKSSTKRQNAVEAALESTESDGKSSRRSFIKRGGKIGDSFRKKVGASTGGVKAKISSARKQQLPPSIAADRWDSVDVSEKASQVLVRPRSSTLPFNLPSSSASTKQKVPAVTPEWDFSDEDKNQTSPCYVPSSDEEVPSSKGEKMSFETADEEVPSSTDEKTSSKTVPVKSEITDDDAIQSEQENAPPTSSGKAVMNDDFSWDFTDDAEQSHAEIESTKPPSVTLVSQSPPSSPLTVDSQSPSQQSSPVRHGTAGEPSSDPDQSSPVRHGTAGEPLTSDPDQFKWNFSDEDEDESSDVIGNKSPVDNTIGTVEQMKPPDMGNKNAARGITKGRFTIQKVEAGGPTPTPQEQESKSDTATANGKVTKGRFSVMKVEEEPNSKRDDEHESSGSQIAKNNNVTKRRFSVENVKETNAKCTKPSHQAQTHKERLAVQKIETRTPDEDTAAKEKSQNSQKTKGRFSVTTVEEPNNETPQPLKSLDERTTAQKPSKLKNEKLSDNSDDTSPFVPKKAQGTGRLKVQTVTEEDGDSVTTSYENDGLVPDETTPMLRDHHTYKDDDDGDDSDDVFSGVLETEI